MTSSPSMELQCKRVWGNDGHFNVSVSVSLPMSEPSNHINRFTFSPTLQRNRQSVQSLAQDTLIPQVNSFFHSNIRLFNQYNFDVLKLMICMTNSYTCRATSVNLWRYYQHSLYQRRTTCTQWRFRYAPMYMNHSTQATTCIKLLPVL